MHGSVSSNQGEVVLDWAIDGHGIVLLSERDVATQIAEGKLVRLLPDYHEPAPVGHDQRARAAHSAKVNACVAFLKEHLAHGPHALRSTPQPDHRRPGLAKFRGAGHNSRPWVVSSAGRAADF